MTEKFKYLIRYFARNQKDIDRWMLWYIHHRNLYNKGQSELSFFKTLVNVPSLMMFWLFIRSIVPDFPFWLFVVGCPILMLIKIVSNWVVGFWWDRNDFYDREADWSNTRNPISKAISENLLDGKGL